jgi:hypothetical protein
LCYTQLRNLTHSRTPTGRISTAEHVLTWHGRILTVRVSTAGSLPSFISNGFAPNGVQPRNLTHSRTSTGRVSTAEHAVTRHSRIFTVRISTAGSLPGYGFQPQKHVNSIGFAPSGVQPRNLTHCRILTGRVSTAEACQLYRFCTERSPTAQSNTLPDFHRTGFNRRNM